MMMSGQGQKRAVTRRPIGYGLAGIVLLVVGCYALYTTLQHRTMADTTPSVYQYTVTQSVGSAVNYFDSSFYEGKPTDTNTAYINDLTKSIDVTFNYHYAATQEASLTYAYNVKASVRADYAMQGTTDDLANVWAKEFVLVEPVTQTKPTTEVTLSPKISIPYADYKKYLAQFKDSLSLPINGNIVVTFTVHVTGDIDGTPLNDLRVATLTSAIDTQIYRPTAKYDKEDTKRVVGVTTQQGRNVTELVWFILAGTLVAGGLALLTYGFRRHIFKPPYQRELDKIYRYHEGLIVKAGPHTDISGKQIVPVQSFDDILNLEEELKSPIVSSSVGVAATRFMIIHGDVVYLYTLGTVARDSGRSLEEIEASIEEQHIAPPTHRNRDKRGGQTKRM